MAKSRNARKGMLQAFAADIPVETAPPIICGEPFERFLVEQDVRMAGIWFWRNSGTEETNGEFLFGVDNLFSGCMTLSIPASATAGSIRQERPRSGRIPVNPVYSGNGCFRYAGPA